MQTDKFESKRKTVEEMKNGYKLQAYPIKLENNDFPNR